MSTATHADGTTLPALAHPGRAAVFAALFARLAALSHAGQSPAPAGRPFATVSRTLLHWSDVAPTACPALFLATAGGVATSRPKLPTSWLWRADVHIYVKTDPRAGASASAALDALVDLVERVFSPDRDGECTLDGLVTRCRIAGDVVTDDGVLGTTAVASIPIEIVPLS